MRPPGPRACSRCHKTKEPERFPYGKSIRGGRYLRRSSVCWTCTEEAAWDYYHRTILTRTTWINPATGRRVRICLECEKVKDLRSGFYITNRKGTRDKNGARILKHRYARVCKRCIKRIGSEHHERAKADAAKWKVRKEQRRRASKRWRERHPVQARAASAKWKAGVLADPERAESYRADQRINYRLRRDAQGKPPRVAKDRAPSRYGELPAAPLVEYLEMMIERRKAHARVMGDYFAVGIVGDLCNEIGVNGRQVRNWKQKGARIGIANAEKVLLRLGVDWREVYPHEYAKLFLDESEPQAA